MNNQLRFAPKWLTAAVLGGVLLVAGCAEKETYLIGKREDLRSVLQDPELAAPQEEARGPNTSRAISLGVARTNASWTHTTGTAKYRVSHPALRNGPQLAWSANIGAGDSRFK